MRWVEVTSCYFILLILGTILYSWSSNKFKRMEYISRDTISRIVESKKLIDIKNRFVSRGKTLERYFLPTTSSHSLPLSSGFDYRLSHAFLSSLLPRPNLNWFSRDRCERVSTQHGSTARSSIDSPFVFPRTSHGIARIYARTTDVWSLFAYIGILFKVCNCNKTMVSGDKTVASAIK